MTGVHIDSDMVSLKHFLLKMINNMDTFTLQIDLWPFWVIKIINCVGYPAIISLENISICSSQLSDKV